VEGIFSGYGLYYFADKGKNYEGEFRSGNMEGKGIETWKDGRKYEGDFKNGRKEGEGTMEWPNGTKYVGSWRSDTMHGNGVYINAREKTKRQGEWANGKRKNWISEPIHIGGS